MKHSLGLAPFLVLTTRSLAFCPPAIRASLSYSTSDSDVTKKTDVCARWSFVWDDASSRCLGESTRSSSWRCRQSSQKGSILMSGVGSTVAPPPRTLSTGRGGGEDGMRELTREESEEAIKSFATSAEIHLGVQSDYTEFMESLDRMRAWVGALDKKRVGCKRMVLGSFKRGKLLSIVAAEVVWSTGSLSRDVRICSRLIVVNPAHDKRTVGFATVDQLKSFGRQNALLLDLSPMMTVPSCRVFCLASMQTLDEDPEQLFQDPIVQQFNSRVRRCCYVLDDIPDWADLGPYWYEGALPRSVRFFFRKKFHAVNEFEVTLQWPGAGLATGSGTVGGARVLPMEEAEAAKDIPGHRKVREIERRLANRLLADVNQLAVLHVFSPTYLRVCIVNSNSSMGKMQDENPVLSE